MNSSAPPPPKLMKGAFAHTQSNGVIDREVGDGGKGSTGQGPHTRPSSSRVLLFE